MARTHSYNKSLVIGLSLFCFALPLRATKLDTLQVVDNKILMIKFVDARVSYYDDFRPKLNSRGECHEQCWFEHYQGEDTLKAFGTALNKSAADAAGSYTITSTDDNDYSSGRNPASVSRKTKAWGVSMTASKPAMNHWVFLRLPNSLKQDKHYTVTVAAGTNTDATSKSFVFNEYDNVSEAIHVNIIRYNPDAPWKTGDVYIWMGTGGARDYAGYAGNAFHLRNQSTGRDDFSGTMKFWKAYSGGDIVDWYDNIGSAVWKCDFSAFTDTGTYRLVIDSIGCSVPFVISRDAFFSPYKVATRGYFFMRVGDSTRAGVVPNSRPVPQWKPGRTPNFRVLYTSAGPGNADNDWTQNALPGRPANPNAWGGWRDAADWDRNYYHSVSAFDMLLAYVLAPAAFGDNDLDINESGNGIPDILDEARFELDFYLRLRSQDGGYSHGINTVQHELDTVLGQGAATNQQAWNVAALSAMMAYAFDLAGQTTLRDTYRDSAVAAYNHASGNGVGNAYIERLREADLKMTAAAYLYNLTGNTSYEDVVNSTSLITSPTSEPIAGCCQPFYYDQTYASVGYLLTKQAVHYATLRSNMVAAISNMAVNQEVIHVTERPSSRADGSRYKGVWSGQNVTPSDCRLSCMAHRFSTTHADSAKFATALYAEAEWGLGRNPLNMVYMTGLGSRCVEQMMAPGWNDGTPCVVPGITPYMSNEQWVGWPYGGTQAYCEPAGAQWPMGEYWFNSRYDVGNSEFTHQQTMRGKMLLYAYLYGMERLGPHWNGTGSRPPVGSMTIPQIMTKRLEIKGARVIFQAGSSGSAIKISVLSLDGKVIRRLLNKTSAAAGIYTYDLSVMGFAAGNYLVMAAEGTNRYNARILVMR